VGEGLKDGERVCITPIEIISEGMKVRVIGDKQIEDTPIPTGQNSESNTSAQ
jgi:hypothetical protein